MTSAKNSKGPKKDFIEYMARFMKEMVINVDSNSSSDDSSDDEVQVVKELKVNTDYHSSDHRCDLCCQGEFLVDRLLRFGGLINEEFKFVCDKCDKNFAQKSKMKHHRAQCKGLVSNRKSFVSSADKQQSESCMVCLRSFKSKAGLTKHLKKSHSGLIHTCEVHTCKKVFTNFEKFRLHCFVHTQNNRSHVCTKCNKKFRYQNTFKDHLRFCQNF